MNSKVRMSDIAKALNVSTVTVSKALSDKEGVGEELRQKIKDKAQEMGYKISSVSKAMRTGRQNNIGILIAERYLEEDSYYWSLYQNILLELGKKQCFGILEIINSEQEKELDTPRIILESKVDAIIVVGQLKRSYLKHLYEESNGKLMFLDFYDVELPVSSVIADNYNGGYGLTRYLIKKGHDDIVYYGDIHATTSIMDRGMGYFKAMLDYRKILRNNWYISDRNEEGLLIDPVLPKDMPSAFVCNSDLSARKLYDALLEQGYKVPGDVSLVGFDNYPNDAFSIGITTMEVGRDKLAMSAINVIEQVLDGSQATEKVSLAVKLVEKESVVNKT